MLTYKTIVEYKLKDECFAVRHTYRDPWDLDTLYGPETHRKFEIIYIVQGEEHYNIEGEQYEIHDGDIIFVMPNEIHSMIGNHKRAFERILVYFDFEMLREMFAVADITIDETFMELRKVNRVIPERLVKKLYNRNNGKACACGRIRSSCSHNYQFVRMYVFLS